MRVMDQAGEEQCRTPGSPSSFSVPRLISPVIDRRRSKSAADYRNQSVTGRKQPQLVVPPDSGRSAYRSVGGSVCTAHTGWSSGDVSKGTNSSFLEHTRDPHATSSAELPDMIAAQPPKGKKPTTFGSSEDVMELSFSDMLKSTKKLMPEPENPEAGSMGKAAKKKGKKGRQIDPSLLGFKVHSNRILMGEIQRPDD
ncbi:hypothetical protein BHM03_00018262 [Ensete ventricosum]|nr:hypothetical protein BHM03_00018262 [Ensete ventricosum]